jgi:hypothetical protein
VHSSGNDQYRYNEAEQACSHENPRREFVVVQIVLLRAIDVNPASLLATAHPR